MASRSICCARGLGENIDKVDDRFLTEPCCVVFKKSFVLGECDRINASLKMSLILDNDWNLSTRNPRFFVLTFFREIRKSEFLVYSWYEKGDGYCMIGSRKEWKRIIRLINDIRQSTSDDKLVNWKLMQIYSGQLKLARVGEQKFRNANTRIDFLGDWESINGSNETIAMEWIHLNYY